MAGKEGMRDALRDYKGSEVRKVRDRKGTGRGWVRDM